MKAATLFSGIGAPEQAMPGWQWLWHAEIEPFPSAVMTERHPGSINLGNVLVDDFAERAERAGRPDVIVFGSPCQSFSIAGRRLGLTDPRGNLALVALALVRRLRPKWFVFENVPGLLSSERGDDFATFLATVAESGYSGCWRVLDARYWHLAQRRERVFFVGSLGDWRDSAAVLSFAEGMRGYPAASRDAREDVASPIAAGSASSSGYRNDADTAENLIAHTLRGDGFDASEDGTGRATLNAFHSRQGPDSGPVTHPLDTDGYSIAVAFAENSRAEVRLEGGDGQTVSSLKTGGGKPGQSYPAIQQAMQVRRLTPRETERLQGYPDDFTAILWRGKTAADGPRYRAIEAQSRALYEELAAA